MTGLTRFAWLGLLLGGVLVAGSIMGAAALAEGDREIAIVVSKDWNELDEIDLPTLRRIYLGKKTAHAGRSVSPIDQTSQSEIRKAFSEEVLERSMSSLTQYWIEQSLAGGAEPPHVARTTERAVARAAKRPGAIAYVDAAELASLGAKGVKVVPIKDGGEVKRPGEPGYSLRY